MPPPMMSIEEDLVNASGILMAQTGKSWYPRIYEVFDYQDLDGLLLILRLSLQDPSHWFVVAMGN